MKIIFFILCLTCATSAFAKNVTFESSDGIWTDCTVDTKGRDFRAVLWSFEAYKFKNKKENVTLVRTTPDLKWKVLRSSKEKSKLEWKVPYSKPSGKAKQQLNSYTQDEFKEITKRVEQTYNYWKNK